VYLPSLRQLKRTHRLPSREIRRRIPTQVRFYSDVCFFSKSASTWHNSPVRLGAYRTNRYCYVTFRLDPGASVKKVRNCIGATHCLNIAKQPELLAREKRQGQNRLPGFIRYDHHQSQIIVAALCFAAPGLCTRHKKVPPLHPASTCHQDHPRPGPARVS
jgi:hypothetical protein